MDDYFVYEEYKKLSRELIKELQNQILDYKKVLGLKDEIIKLQEDEIKMLRMLVKLNGGR